MSRINPIRRQTVTCPKCGRISRWRKIVGVAGKAIVDVHEDRHGDLCGPHRMEVPTKPFAGEPSKRGEDV